jgi:hypothetical protein
MAARGRGITVGDWVVACDVHRGEVVLLAKSGRWVLVRVLAGELTRSGYLMCLPGEVQRMNAWWACADKRVDEARVGARVWERGASRPAVKERRAA